MSIFFADPAPAPEPQPRPYREAIDVDGDSDLYRPLSASRRDLLGNALWRAQEMSVAMYRANPLANRIIKIYTTFMAGTGFGINCANPEVQGIADEFWHAERSQMAQNARGYARDGLLFGESIHPVAVDPMGNTTFGFIDPTTVHKIRRSPLNNMILESVHIRDDGFAERVLEVVQRQTDDPFAPDAGLLAGETFAWLHDRIGAASRGTPFLLPIIDWLDAYDQTLWELLERVKATRAFFWDVSVQGGQDEIDDAKAIFGTSPPTSGSVRFRTDAMDVTATQPQIGAYEDVAAARAILAIIATGAGVAPHWLGDPNDTNRSTAESMDKPVMRALEDVQMTWKYQIEQTIRFAVEQKIAAGMLPRVVERHDANGQPTGEQIPAHEAVAVMVPELGDEDITAAAGALAQVAGAFVQLSAIDAIGPEAMQKVVRHLLPAIGIPADEIPDDDEMEANPNLAGERLEALYDEARRGRLDQLLEELTEVA